MGQQVYTWDDAPLGHYRKLLYQILFIKAK